VYREALLRRFWTVTPAYVRSSVKDKSRYGTYDEGKTAMTGGFEFAMAA